MPVYLITYILLFWVPVFLMAGLLWKTLSPAEKKSFMITIAIMTAATFVMEFVYIKLKIWTFSEQVDKLVGIWIWHVPIEEFVFWWGASPLFLFMYLTYNRLLPKKARAR